MIGNGPAGFGRAALEKDPQGTSPASYLDYPRPGLGSGVHQDRRVRAVPVWVYLNGNEWAKQQASQHGVSFKALDNGFASSENPEQLAAICHSLSAGDVRLFFDRWQAALPSPLTVEDRARGYGHALAFRQLEISDTRVFDRPAAGRAWFEATIPISSRWAGPTRPQSSSAAA